jgi:Tol biopolymer transport system component
VFLDWPDGKNAKSCRIFQEESFTSPPAFDWLPDSKHMVLSIAGNICLADATRGSIERLAASIGSNAALPSLSPDGTRIVFASEASDFDLMEVPLDGSKPIPFLATARDEQYPSRPSSGDKTAFLTRFRSEAAQTGVATRRRVVKHSRTSQVNGAIWTGS